MLWQVAEPSLASLERAIPPGLRSYRFERCFLVDGMTRQSRAQLIAEYLTLRLQPGREADHQQPCIQSAKGRHRRVVPARKGGAVRLAEIGKAGTERAVAVGGGRYHRGRLYRESKCES